MNLRERFQSTEARLDGETLWLTQRQMGELSGTTSETILTEGKLPEEATAKDFLEVREEGKRQPLNEQDLAALKLLTAECDP